jgi:hypothetical protein
LVLAADAPEAEIAHDRAGRLQDRRQPQAVVFVVDRVELLRPVEHLGDLVTCSRLGVQVA